MSSTNRVQVAVARVTDNQHPTAAVPTLQKLRLTGAPSLAFTPETIVSDEIRSDRQRADLIPVGAEAGGDVNHQPRRRERIGPLAQECDVEECLDQDQQKPCPLQRARDDRMLPFGYETDEDRAMSHLMLLPESRDALPMLDQRDAVGLDTEFMREKTYYAELCLVQVAAGETLLGIDPKPVKADIRQNFHHRRIRLGNNGADQGFAA